MRPLMAVLGALVCIAAPVLTFSRVFSSPAWTFLDLDDGPNFVRNVHIQEITLSNLRWMVSDGVVLDVYEPVSLLLKAACHWMFKGPDAQALVCTTVLLHALTAAVAFGTGLKLCSLMQPASKQADAASWPELGCLFGALLFAVHPLRAEVVGWPSCQPYALSSLFALGCVWAHLVHRERTPLGSGGGWDRYKVLSTSLCALAVFSKSSSVPVAPLLVMLDMLLLAQPSPRQTTARGSSSGGSGGSGGPNPASPTPRAPIRLLPAALRSHLPALLPALLAARFALLAKRKQPGAVDAWAHEAGRLDGAARAQRAGYALLAHHPSKLVWPAGLALRYHHPPPHQHPYPHGTGVGGVGGVGDVLAWPLRVAQWLWRQALHEQAALLACALTFSLFAAAVLRRPAPAPPVLRRPAPEQEQEPRRAAAAAASSGGGSGGSGGGSGGSSAGMRALAALWFAYVLLLFPTLGFVQHGAINLASDRHAYLPSAALLPSAGAAAAALLASALSPPSIPGGNRRASGSGGSGGGRSARDGDGAKRRRAAKGGLAALVAAAAVMAAVLLPLGSLAAGPAEGLLRWADSEAMWRSTVLRDPTNVQALKGLGALRGKAGAPAEEEEGWLRRAVRAEPEFVPALTAHGSALTRLGRHREAVAQVSVLSCHTASTNNLSVSRREAVAAPRLRTH